MVLAVGLMRTPDAFSVGDFGKFRADDLNYLGDVHLDYLKAPVLPGGQPSPF